VICVRKGSPCRMADAESRSWLALVAFSFLPRSAFKADQPHGATHAAQAKGDAESADVPIPADNDADHGSNSGTDAGQPSLDVKQTESDADSGGAEAVNRAWMATLWNNPTPVRETPTRPPGRTMPPTWAFSNHLSRARPRGPDTWMATSFVRLK